MLTSEASPVFVVGMNGSGTTMLADCLGRHAALYMLPRESKVLPYFLSQLPRFGDLALVQNRRRLAISIGRSKAFWHTNGKSSVVLDDAILMNCSTFGEVVSQIYLAFALRQGKKRWGDKSPANTHFVSELANAFPTAKFVHIIRDGREAAQSFHRRWGYNPQHTVWRWKRTVTTGRNQGLALTAGRYLEVYYEKVTQYPQSEMERICNFLSLEFDPAVLTSAMPFLAAGTEFAHTGRIVENSGKWRSYFRAEQIEAMEGIGGQLLLDLGYAVDSPGNAELSEFRGRILRVRDALSFGYSDTVTFFKRNGLKAWPSYLRGLADSAKQWVATKH